MACVLLYSAGWDPRPSIIPTLLFAALITIASRLGLRLGEAGKASVAHTLVVASFLALGFPAALWATLLSSLANDALRTLWPLEGETRHRPPDEVFQALAMNAGMHLIALVTGAVCFSSLGGTLPVTGIAAETALPLMGLFLGYFLVDLGYFILYQAMRGEDVIPYVGRQFPRIALVELLPQPLAVLIAAVYHQRDWGNFLLLMGGGIAGMILIYHLDLSRQRLQERVEELSALNAIGHELNRFLDVDALLEVVYREAGKVLDFRNFYVALYDEETRTIHFPLVYEDGKRQTWRSRPFQSGLTEHVIRTRKPLLIHEDERVEAAHLGVQPVGKPARSWLGVPLLAGDQVLGVLALQDYEQAHAYTEADAALLSTIAAQAAVAIRNAQLYQQADAQLAHRVQQLQAVLDSTDEGFLFLDAEGTVLMANPCLHALWHAAPGTLVGRSLLSDPDLRRWAGLPPSATLDDLVRLSQGQGRALV
ncbi:MAG: GAF domain-containing protein, partial [Anaerolineae bacterium]